MKFEKNNARVTIRPLSLRNDPFQQNLEYEDVNEIDQSMKCASRKPMQVYIVIS